MVCKKAYTGATEYVDVYRSVIRKDSLVVVCRGFIGTRQTTTLDRKYIEYLIYQRQYCIDDMTRKLEVILINIGI